MIKFTTLGKISFKPELKENNGKKYCGLIVQSSKKDKNGNWVNNTISMLAFDKTAEYCAKYLQEKDQVYIEGDIKGEYNKENKTTSYKFFANNVQGLTYRTASSETQKIEDKVNGAFPTGQSSFADQDIPF